MHRRSICPNSTRSWRTNCLRVRAVLRALRWLLQLYALTEAAGADAVPVFLRFSKELETTSTFKQVKTTLVKQGIDITQVRRRVCACARARRSV